MGDFEDRVKAAFDAEIHRAPARPGLRQRVIANAVATPRTRPSWFSVFTAPPRLALVGAAAAVLIVAGVGIRAAIQTTSPMPSVQLAFGKMPAPSLHPPVGIGGGGPVVSTVPYFGPATMTWSGQMPLVPASAPVYRFNLPTIADADALAARLHGTWDASTSTNVSRSYRLPGGFMMSVSFADPVAGEPSYSIYATTQPSTTSQPLGETGARAAADSELARFGLTPSWTHTVSVTTIQGLINQGPLYAVQYQRTIDIAKGVTAGEVDGAGDPAGIRIVVDSSGKAQQVSGIFRLTETKAMYPLRSPSSTVKDALSAPPAIQEPAQSGPPPTVALTKVVLVYTVVRSTGVGYLVPAYLYTGTFTEKGPMEKRVLIPGLPANAMRS